jgi:hypothetical protein
MRETLRALLPAAIAVALATAMGAAPAMAQGDDGINADKVDGRDAVGALASCQERAKNLVATNREGRLPSNIIEPLWKLMKGIPTVLADGRIGWAELVNIPADLADGQIGWAEILNKPGNLVLGPVGWNEIVNKPAGFADGIDNGGFVSQVVATFPGPWDGGNKTIRATFDVSRNVDIDCYAIPISGPAYWQVTDVNTHASNDVPGNVFWDFYFQSPNQGAGEVKIRCRSYSEGIATAALKQGLENGKVTVKKGKKGR